MAVTVTEDRGTWRLDVDGFAEPHRFASLFHALSWVLGVYPMADARVEFGDGRVGLAQARVSTAVPLGPVLGTHAVGGTHFRYYEWVPGEDGEISVGRHP